MGLFEQLGRRVERFKQAAEQTAAESEVYECRDCGERFHTDHDQCPACGSERVAHVDDEA